MQGWREKGKEINKNLLYLGAVERKKCKADRKWIFFLSYGGESIKVTHRERDAALR